MIGLAQTSPGLGRSLSAVAASFQILLGCSQSRFGLIELLFQLITIVTLRTTVGASGQHLPCLFQMQPCLFQLFFGSFDLSSQSKSGGLDGFMLDVE